MHTNQPSKSSTRSLPHCSTGSERFRDPAVGAAVSFADIEAQQVAFRYVSIGDAAVLTLRIGKKQHYIPRQFSETILANPGTVRRTMEIMVRVPASLSLRHDERQLPYEEIREEDDLAVTETIH